MCFSLNPFDAIDLTNQTICRGSWRTDRTARNCVCLFELSFYAEKKQKRHRFCSDFYAYDLLITNQLLYQLSYTSVEIGLPASYPLYAPKRRIMALKYNINSSGLCQAPFLPDGENFYGSAVLAFPLAFFAARL